MTERIVGSDASSYNTILQSVIIHTHSYVNKENIYFSFEKKMNGNRQYNIF